LDLDVDGNNGQQDEPMQWQVDMDLMDLANKCQLDAVDESGVDTLTQRSKEHEDESLAGLRAPVLAFGERINGQNKRQLR
jgi:hypothetical protein